MKGFRIKVERGPGGRHRYLVQRRKDGQLLALSRYQYHSVGDAKKEGRAELARLGAGTMAYAADAV